MPRIEYMQHRFHSHTLERLHQADAICREYAELGITITLRSLFYQFVARGLMKNSLREYKRLGDTLNEARLSGYLDWSYMKDITRMLRGVGHMDDPPSALESLSAGFRLDKWENQPNYVEVWIEKDAVVGTISQTCNQLDVPFLSCRGYTSQSELWRSAMRIANRIESGKEVTIIHLGDHDPSGIDMTRDIDDRVRLFVEHHTGQSPEINRIALNMDQIRQYNPPPNPAKVTDSRFAGYLSVHGRSSWELDALDPRVMRDIISDSITPLIDQDLLDETRDAESRMRDELSAISERYDDVSDFVTTVTEDGWEGFKAFVDDPRAAIRDHLGADRYDDYMSWVKNRPRYLTEWLTSLADEDETSVQWLL
jgi:hypothetical protein